MNARSWLVIALALGVGCAKAPDAPTGRPEVAVQLKPVPDVAPQLPPAVPPPRVLALAPPPRAREIAPPPRPKPVLYPETVEAWKARGFELHASSWWGDYKAPRLETFAVPAGVASRRFGVSGLPPVLIPFGVKLDYTSPTNADLRELAVHDNLIRLSLKHTRLSEAWAKEIGAFRHLTGLDLYGTSLTDTGLQEVAKLSNLTELGLTFTDVTDAGMKHVAVLNNLTVLDLSVTWVTGAGLKELAPLTKLNRLGYKREQVTDDVLASLKAIGKLHALYEATYTMSNRPTDEASIKVYTLEGSKVTDEGLKHLTHLTNLTELRVRYSKVTKEGAQAFEKARPGCKVIFDD